MEKKIDLLLESVTRLIQRMDRLEKGFAKLKKEHKKQMKKLNVWRKIKLIMKML